MDAPRARTELVFFHFRYRLRPSKGNKPFLVVRHLPGKVSFGVSNLAPYYHRGIQQVRVCTAVNRQKLYMSKSQIQLRLRFRKSSSRCQEERENEALTNTLRDHMGYVSTLLVRQR